MDIVHALLFGWPGKEFTVGSTYESLVCHGWDKPTEAALDTAWQGYLAQRDKDTQRTTILAQLAELDAKSIRPLRDGDTARLADLEAQAAALRQQLQEL